jgi:capsular polysaccharide export protein
MDQVLHQVDEVHVLTSLAASRPSCAAKPVVCWGSPFYAGWGLTADREPMPRRQRGSRWTSWWPACCCCIPTYVSRVSGHFTTAERALDELQAWRAERLRCLAGIEPAGVLALDACAMRWRCGAC